MLLSNLSMNSKQSWPYQFRALYGWIWYCFYFHHISIKTAKARLYSKADHDWHDILKFFTHCNFNPTYNLTDINSKWQFLRRNNYYWTNLPMVMLLYKLQCRPKWFSSEIHHKLNCIVALLGKTKERPSLDNIAEINKGNISLRYLCNGYMCVAPQIIGRGKGRLGG